MVKHIVMWNYKEGLTAEENAANAQKVKANLEGLKSLVPEIVDIKVIINDNPNSTHDIMLDSTFKDEDGFKAYKVNPDHSKAGAITKEVLHNRVCMDYYTE